MKAPDKEYGPATTLEALRVLYKDLPPALRAEHQGLAACTHPLTILDWTAEDFADPPDRSQSGHDGGPPPVRRDFYTGEVFVERQSNFTLRARDLEECTALRCVECENFTVDLSGLTIQERIETRQKFFLHFYGCSGFKVRGISSSGGRNLALLEDCFHFTVSEIDCRDYEGYGLIVLHSRFFRIEDCRFVRNLASGVMILGDCRHGTITDCRFLGSRGYYNWDAGLHICHCSRRITAAQVPELAHEPLPIRNKTMRPSRIRVQRSVFKDNRSQGIYLEGASQCLLIDNILRDNNKEGICLDWGTSLCVLRANTVTGNGDRAKMTEAELEIDFVRDFPLLPDQSSSCKLPGISFDNGVLNAIIENHIQGNFGGGIKMVRAAVGNLIVGNYFSKNDRGANSIVKKMHDILILTLGNRDGEFDQNRMELLDFCASSFNAFRDNVFSADPSEAIHHERELNRFEGNQFNVPEKTLSLRGTITSPHPEPPTSRGCSAHLQSAGASPSPHVLYAFGNVTDRHHSVFQLRPDGVIEFSVHPNESHWRVEGRQLLFFDRDYRITTCFDFFIKPTGETVFVGRYKETSILHYLVPLIDTGTPAPTSDELPPLFLNSLPGCPASLLEQFFADLGWVPTRLHFRPDGMKNLTWDHASVDRRLISGDNRLLSFPKIASIIRPGQSMTGSLPWREEYRHASSSLFRIHGCRNLRTTLVSHCVHEETKARASPTTHTTWHLIADPRDRFLAFLDLFAAEHRICAEFSGWFDAGPEHLVRSEDLLREVLDPSLLERLAAFGISYRNAQAALQRASDANRSASAQEAPDWTTYWSATAEHRFRLNGLYALNQRMGYED